MEGFGKAMASILGLKAWGTRSEKLARSIALDDDDGKTTAEVESTVPSIPPEMLRDGHIQNFNLAETGAQPPESSHAPSGSPDIKLRPPCLLKPGGDRKPSKCQLCQLSVTATDEQGGVPGDDGTIPNTPHFAESLIEDDCMHVRVRNFIERRGKELSWPSWLNDR